MADLPERDEWTPGIYQIETSDPVLGGPDGVDNLPAKGLANRTRWLKGQIDKLISGVSTAAKATQLATARYFRITGAASGSVLFDGSKDVTIELGLSDSGIVPGYYSVVGVNRQGLVVEGTRPTTLEGLGIYDALLLKGGTMSGPIVMAGANSIYIQPRAGGQWAGGFMTASANLDQLQAGIGFSGQNESLQNVYLGLGATPWSSGIGIRISVAGVAIEGPITGVGSGLTGLRWSALIEVPKTLGGIGVQFATQSEAQAGVDTTKPVNAVGVAQAIAAQVVQATEIAPGKSAVASQADLNDEVDDSRFVTARKLAAWFSGKWNQATEAALGVSKVATQADLTAGADDTRFVTAKKLSAWLSTKVVQASYAVAGLVTFANANELINTNTEAKVLSPAVVKYGFALLSARNGYIAFPTWLGGLIIQWGTVTIPATTTDVPFPLTYPIAEFATIATSSNATFGLDGVEINYAEVGFFKATIVSANTAATQVAGTFKFISVGR